MNVTEKLIRCIKIEGAPKLDPITVMLDEMGVEKHKAQITVECYGESWSVWRGMGSDAITYLAHCDANHLAGNFASSAQLKQYVPDYRALGEMLQKAVIYERKIRAIDSVTAEEVYETAKYWDSESDMHDNQELLDKYLDEGWQKAIPETINHKFKYLERICAAIIDAAKELLKAKESAA